MRAFEKIVASEGRSHFAGAQERFARSETARKPRQGRVSRMTRATGVYSEIHEDPEHRRNTRSQAQQIFSQALTSEVDRPCRIAPYTLDQVQKRAVSPRFHPQPHDRGGRLGRGLQRAK